MGKRRVHARLRKTARAKKHAGVQAKALDAAREIAAADVVTSEGNEEGIRRNVAVPAKEPVETLVEVGDDYDIGFIVACARFDPCLPLTHLVRGSQVSISVAAANFQTTEFVDQEVVHHAGHCIRSVDRRGTVLQNVDVIDHREGNQIDIVAAEQCGRGEALSVDQNQSLLWQQAAQVNLRRAITAVGNVLVNRSARLLRDKRGQVSGIADAQFLDVLWSIRVHGVRTSLFRCGNVRTGHNDALDFSLPAGSRRSWNGRSRQLRECVGRQNEGKSDARH